MQNMDYSCGTASLATLMQFYFNDKITESMILDVAGNITLRSEKDLKEKGLSLLDMKKIAEHFGYRAAGFKMTIKQLRQLKGPVIIFFKPFDYEHFAVLKGIRGNRVFIADPSRGNYRDAVYRFKKEWDGVVLALDKNSKLTEDSVLSIDSVQHVRPEFLSIERMMQLGNIVKPARL